MDTESKSENKIEPVLSDRVVVLKLIDGSDIIALVTDDELFLDVAYLFQPKLFLTTVIDDDEEEYSFKDWLIGAKHDIHCIEPINIVIWYEVEEAIAYEFMAYCFPNAFTNIKNNEEIDVDDKEAILIHISEYLKTKSTVH